jgi:hypothetical protein
MKGNCVNGKNVHGLVTALARLFDITINNGTIPRDWKKAIVVPIHKGGDRSVVKN